MSRIAVIAYLRAHPGATIPEMSRELRISKNSIQSYLDTLFVRHVVERTRPDKRGAFKWHLLPSKTIS